ncbi:enoyl-CoA hydratase/isomerase family protein [Nocardia arizonensis]|uniref:enoyl-CoA hydratase/isomerase family protein n=1 Tax=Nocardia arizonensis TaxID=1141647 RepID=UPI0006D067ED|nr:enoyl-CoA hydratase-related protein [Nocardia arizonensis]
MVITIDRPEARNALDRGSAEIIGSALEQADGDASVWAVILTGTGERAFCAGADLKAIARGESLYQEGREHWSFGAWANHYISKPTIAAVNGVAFGGGLELVLAADLAVATESAKFGLPETSRGIIAAAGGAFRVIDQLPRKVGMHMLMTGLPIDAATAMHHGLINEVVPDGQALEAALALAETVCRNSPTAVAASKRIAYGATENTWAGESERWSLTNSENQRVRQSHDGREGPKAFAEKRNPVWQNS